MVSTTVGDTGSGLAATRPTLEHRSWSSRSERKRSQKQVEDAIREALAADPRHRASSLGNRPIYVALLGRDPKVLETEVLRLRREGQARCPASPTSTTSVKPGLPAYAVRLKPDAVRELGLTTPQLAASLRAYVNGDVATYWTTPDGEQVEVELRLPHGARERVDADARAAGGVSPRTARRSRWRAWPTSCRWSTRTSSGARTCSAARRSSPASQGRPSGDVGADVQKLVKATAAAARLPLRRRRPDARSRQEAFSGVMVARWRWR